GRTGRDGLGDELDLVDQPELDGGDAHLAGKRRGGGEGEFHGKFLGQGRRDSPPSLRAKRSNPWRRKRKDGLLRRLRSRNDGVATIAAALRRDDLLPLLAEALDAQRDDVADIEELRRLHAGADAGRRAGGDDVAGQ